MITADQLIEIGRYNKAHGINGEISATFDCDTMAVGELSALVSPMDGIFVPFFVNGIRPKNNEQDKVYCDFFIGFTITDTDGNTIGTITDVDDSTENALFVVENEGKTVYIPISEDFITEIDEQGKTIEMDLPEGILDL